MPAKKSEAQEKKNGKKKVVKEDKYVLLRELSSHILLIVPFNDISTSSSFKVAVGTQVSFAGANRVRGRGMVLCIGTESECTELLVVLEKSDPPRKKDTNRSKLISDDSDDQKSDKESEGEDEDEKSSTTNKKDDIIVEKYVESNKSDNTTTGVQRKLPAENKKRTLPLSNKSLNEDQENSPATKRLKCDADDSSNYYLARIAALENQNKKLKDKIEQMEVDWMPRPDQTTIEYFSTIVSICTGKDKDYDDERGDKIASIMTLLKVTEKELDDCIVKKSIRCTCRNLVRLVLKNELADPEKSFGSLLKNPEKKEKFTAIREYGRLIHPIESLRFTDGELNNAMGSDFYQRDRQLKHQTTDSRESTEDDIEDNNDAE